MAPCPTTIATFGALLWLRLPRRRAGVLLVIPALWAVVGSLAALRLGVLQDLGLPLAASLAVAGLRRATPVGPARAATR